MNLNPPRVPLIAGAVLVALLSACSTAPVPPQVEFDQSAAFAMAKTFAVRPMPKQIPGVDPGMVQRISPAAMEAASAGMKLKGYTEETSAARADLAVLVHGKAVPQTEVEEWGFTPNTGSAGWYHSYAYGTFNENSVTVDKYIEGTLIVEVYDVKTRKMIWVGWVSGEATEQQEQQAANISRNIARILAEYPAIGTIPPVPTAKQP
jgi:Domain of unknown function (DUF4136)